MLFVQEYLIDLDAGAAAHRAGYGKTKRSSAVIANRLRRRRVVAEAINALIQERSGATQARVVEELAKIAFSDIRSVMSVNGDVMTVKDLDDLPDDVAATIASVEEHITDKGHRAIRVKFYDKLTALGQLEKILGMRRSPTSEAPAVQVNIQNNVSEAGNDVLRRLDAMLPRQLPAPLSEPMPLLSPITIEEPAHVEP
jgi:phage terminase small subunit